MSWNYRVGKHTHTYKDKFPDNEALSKTPDVDLFSIYEIYYDEDGKPNGYAGNANPTQDWESVEELKGTVELLKSAFTMSILDMDNFPEELKITKNDINKH